MSGLARLRLPRYTAQHAGRDAGKAPGCPEVPALAETPAGSRGDEGSCASRTAAARWRCGPSLTADSSPASAGCEDRRLPRLLDLAPVPHALAVGPDVVATWCTRWPSAHTRVPFRWPALLSRGWHGEWKAMLTDDAIAAHCFGSFLNAYRRPLPRRAPGNSICMRLRGLSKPSVRIPRTPSDGARGCGGLQCAVGRGKATALVSSVEHKCQRTGH